MMNRRQLLSLAAVPAAKLAAQAKILDTRSQSLEFIVVRATKRTSWFFIRIKTRNGLSGLGECSDSLGANYDDRALARLRSALDFYFSVIKDQPLSIEAYRNRARARRSGRTPGRHGL